MVGEVPAYLSQFVGRRREADDLAHVIARHRVVTVVGPGGVGKTRLTANVVDSAASSHWPGGVRWVDLTTASSDVAEFAAAALEILVDPHAGPVQSLAAALSNEVQLLCLDNCEAVIEEAAELIDQLARSCPELHVVATTREVLRIDGETVWRMPALAADDAVALFEARCPPGSASTGERSTIRRICRRLDGIPLAIEFAAGWTRSMSLAQIEAGLDDRFTLLVRGPRRAPERHETLLASMQWSYDLLDDAEQAVLRRLGVFVGSFDEQCASAVAAVDGIDDSHVPTILRALVDKSLVNVAADAQATRFVLLDTVRDFALRTLEQRDESDLFRRRHLAAMRARIASLAPLLRTDKDAWRAQALVDHHNIRAALDWGLGSGDPDDARHLAAGFAWAWHLTRFGAEGIGYLERAIRCAPDEASRLQAELYTALALVADTTNPISMEFDVAQRALEIAAQVGDDDLRAMPLLLSAVGLLYTESDAAVELSFEAEQAGVDAGDQFVIDGARAVRGIAWHMMDRHHDAVAILEPLVERFLERGERTIASMVLTALANGYLLAGEVPAALRCGSVAVSTADPLGDFFAAGTSRAQHATTQLAAGDVAGAEQTLAPILETSGDGLERGFAPSVFFAVAELRRRQGRMDDAVQLLQRELGTGAFDGSYLGANMTLELVYTLRCAGRSEEALRELNRDDHTLRAMQRTNARVAIERAWLATDAGGTAVIEALHDALSDFVERNLVGDTVSCIEAFAHLAARNGAHDDAVRLWACADTTREQIGIVREAFSAEVRERDSSELVAAMGADNYSHCHELGSRASLADIVGYARRGRGERGRPDRGWESLTPTELAVAEFVAAGLSNPEVGERLFMSRSTVKSHLSRVYTKLDISNRTELAGIIGGRADVSDTTSAGR